VLNTRIKRAVCFTATKQYNTKIDTACIMRTPGKTHPSLPVILLLNAGIAVITAGAALVVLLIAPLGMAAVLACSGSVAVLSFVLGVLADLWLWHDLSFGRSRQGFSDDTGWDARKKRRGLPPQAGATDLPAQRRP
jgi:hypothetical protein